MWNHFKGKETEAQVRLSNQCLTANKFWSQLDPKIHVLNNYFLAHVLLIGEKNGLLKEPLHSQPRNGISFSISSYSKTCIALDHILVK